MTPSNTVLPTGVVALITDPAMVRIRGDVDLGVDDELARADAAVSAANDIITGMQDDKIHAYALATVAALAMNATPVTQVSDVTEALDELGEDPGSANELMALSISAVATRWQELARAGNDPYVVRATTALLALTWIARLRADQIAHRKQSDEPDPQECP